MAGLSVSDLVRVTVNLSPLAASVRSFGVLLICGDSDVISGAERVRTYTTIDGVAADFGTTAPEYLAAAKYFGQSPKPSTVMIGRYFYAASSGSNLGGILSSSEQTLSIFTAISNGGFSIAIDGTTQDLTGLDFSGCTNLNGVATVITDALSGAVCTWDGTEFVITSSTTGAGTYAEGTITLDTNPSYGVQASGTIILSGQPSNGDTVTIKGTAVTFVSGTASGNQVQIAGSALLTAAALQTFLQNSADTNLAACTYNTISLTTTITARAYGTAGNSYGLLKSGANIAVSASTLLGGVAADTLTVNGTAITFVRSGASGNQVVVGATANATAANLQTFLAASADSNINDANYSTSLNVITVTDKTLGTGGNSFTLAKSSSHISVSGATLSGGTVPSSVGYAVAPGSGTNISASPLKLTSSTNQALIAGYDAETPVACAAVMANLSAAWYGLMFQASVQPTDDQNISVCDFIEALDLTRIFGVTITNTNALSAVVTSDLASRMKDGAYRQSFNQYSQNAYAIASMFGRAFSVNFAASNSTITLMYKQEPGVNPEELTETQALVLKSKRCNSYDLYVNDTSIVQFGVMSGPAYFDEIHGLDWLQNAMQTACFNVLYQSGKVPQTDAGVNQLVNAIGGVCQQAVNNGLVAPGIWNASGFGNLSTGQYLKTGFYIYALPIALQSQSDRETRAAPPIQVAVKLAGAIQSVDVIVDVNR